MAENIDNVFTDGGEANTGSGAPGSGAPGGEANIEPAMFLSVSSVVIEEYVCNLIAGRTILSGLYDAVERARASRANGTQFCYRFKFPIFDKNGNITEIKSILLTGNQLVYLDRKALNCSLGKLLTDFCADPTPTDENLILLLLKLRNTILGLYQARYRAMFMKSTGRIFCYKFTNPFKNFDMIENFDKDCLTFSNAHTFLNFFCQCEKSDFIIANVVPKVPTEPPVVLTQ